MQHLRYTPILLVVALLLSSCGIYSFSGTSIKPDVKTITIEPVENKAIKVNPTLANSMTEALKDKFRKLTSLESVDMDGDLNLYVKITSYEVRAQGITANEVVAQNRLTATVSVSFENRKHQEESFENKQFVAYQDFPATQLLNDVE